MVSTRAQLSPSSRQSDSYRALRWFLCATILALLPIILLFFASVYVNHTLLPILVNVLGLTLSQRDSIPAAVALLYGYGFLTITAISEYSVTTIL